MQDHFSGHADAYARSRPRYPEELFAWLASVSSGRSLAWDVGTGNGQVAEALTKYVDRVIATDASAEQLARAVEHERIEYRLEPADHSSLADGSADWITAGSAAHWFELEGFYHEVRRVARKGAVLALFSYSPNGVADAIDPVVHHYQEEILAGFWPDRIRYANDRYRSLPFPFEEIPAPPLSMRAEWNLEELIAFLETWSAAQRYFVEHGTRATERIRRELSRVWGDADERRIIEFPLFVRAARITH